MHIITTNYNSNPNIGLFCYATDKYCLVPVAFPSKLKKEFEEALGVPVHEMKAAGTELLGVFFAGTDDLLLVPPIMFDTELERLDKLGIKYHVVDSELTALGNNLFVTDKIIIASEEYEDSALKSIEKATGIKVKKGKIGSFDIVGSLAISNKKGALVSADIEDFELKFLKDNTKLKIEKGTLNFGSPYVSSGVVCNTKGFVVGDASGGPEIQNLDVALGFLEDN
jgi:translation initiation factor 6